MSRYTPSDYRARERSRSPPRFGADRRASTANLFDGRPPGPARSASDAPRGPRSQFDNARPPIPAGGPPGNAPRPPYPSLRDAPPLGSGDRGRSFREREYDRRDRLPSPRDRSPPRNLKDTREFPPREGDIRPRRDSRDGPLPASSSYPEGPSLSSAPFRGGYRGRGRGEFAARGGGRGGRSDIGERDLIRRPERSPPRAWARDTSRDSRDSDRRDDRRFDRRDDERRPPEWQDRERELDRARRDQPPSRLEARVSNESIGSANNTYASTAAARINPDRLAMIEGQAAEPPLRRQSVQYEAPPPRETKREQPETPAYLNGRPANTARYETRGSSSPQQAPPVPAFGTLSFAPPPASSAPSSHPSQLAKPEPEQAKASTSRPQSSGYDQASTQTATRPAPPPDAPTGPKDAPPPTRAQINSPTSTAPRAPRAHESDEQAAFGSRLQHTRSLESLSSQNNAAALAHNWRQERTGPLPSPSSASVSQMPTLNQPVMPYPSQSTQSTDLGAAPSGPRGARASPAQASKTPNLPSTSPRSDVGPAQAAGLLPKQSTPPPTAPTGPRARPYSVSPKAAPPTAPKAERGPPLAPRGLERGPVPPSRAADRLAAPPAFQPPSAPRGLQWNQWKRGGPGGFNDKTVPAKRDISGEEKGRPDAVGPAQARAGYMTRPFPPAPLKTERSAGDEIDIDKQTPKRQSSLMSGSGHSAAANFFGKAVADVEEDDNDTGTSEAGQDVPSTSEDDDSDPDEIEGNIPYFHAKYEREKRQLEAQMVDLSQQRYRAMSPLESISRLVRISARDLQRVNEMREREMDVDDSPALQHSHLPRTAQSSESADGPDLPTPRGDDDHRVIIRDSDDSSEGIRPVRRPSPERISLPYLVKDKRHSFSDGHFQRQQDASVEVMRALDDEAQLDDDLVNEVEHDFMDQYRKWKVDCEDLDRLRDELEKLERQVSLEPKPEVDVPMVQPINPFEGRGRLHKYSSEYDVEQVLKQSEETARIEQERQDREAKKNQADMEKEATVPDQRTHAEAKRATFIDNNRYREPKALTQVFSYEPRADDFSENEQQIFIAAFKDTPKKWGEIASLLPGRTYEDCIRHYYTNKWDGRFRDNRTKKLKAGGRRGRGGGRGQRGRIGGLMADLARPEDYMSIDAMNERGRPKRAAAPTTFGEKEAETKAALLAGSPAKKPGPLGKKDGDADGGPDKPGKRQKRPPGEKPGRKAKNGQPLLAAAPQGSPAKQFLTNDQPRAQKLEEASLLAGLQAGHQGVFNSDVHMLYHQERYLQPTGPPDDPGDPRPGQAPVAKQSASSYWSVPEQNDFVKYIAHFGHDFAAISAHMGTKTQTMIKNHFTRQVEGGNRPELERAASDADERWARGEDVGPAPTPTPIQKRKYESAPSSAQRPLAPQADAMDIDNGGSVGRVQMAKHASPPQYQARPLMTSSIQGTPIQAPRAAPSPLPTTVAAAQPPVSNAAHTRPSQHPLGSRISLMPDNLHDQRPSQAGFGLRAADESAAGNQARQPNRPPTDARNPPYLSQIIQDAAQEQQRAMRLERQQLPQDQFQRQNPLLRHSSQGSPTSQPMQPQQERKSVLEDRAPTPPRPSFSGSSFPRPLTSTPFQPLFSSLGNRSSFPYSPTKREETRATPLASIPPANTPPKPSTPAEPPKRSTVMSLLNNDDDPPPPPKRENPTPVPQAQRTSSPASLSNVHGSTSVGPSSAMPGMRREPSFGQASIPQSHFGRMSFGQSNAPVQAPPTPKNEPGSGNASVSQTPKPEWHPGMFSQQRHNQQNPTLERDVRPYFQHGGHRSLLGALGQPRANPSPPPMGGVSSHSRTPSLTARSEMQGRDQGMPGSVNQQQTPSHQPGQALHPNPYASQPPPFSQPQNQAQNQAHHSHNSSLGASMSFPGLHHRVPSRDEQFRQQEQAHREQAHRDQVQRDHERNDHYRHQEAKDAERRREEEQQRYLPPQQQQQQHQHEQDRLHRQQQQQHPQPLHPPPPFASAPFGGVDLRRQSEIDARQAMEQERQRNEVERRRQQEGLLQRDREEEYRRRQQEEMFRRTPLGGGYGGGPPPPGQQQQQGPPRR